MRKASVTALKRLGVVTVIMALMSCASIKASGGATEAAICGELRADLPTFDVDADSRQTAQEVARFIDVFDAVCGN